MYFVVIEVWRKLLFGKCKCLYQKVFYLQQINCTFKKSPHSINTLTFTRIMEVEYLFYISFNSGIYCVTDNVWFIHLLTFGFPKLWLGKNAANFWDLWIRNDGKVEKRQNSRNLGKLSRSLYFSSKFQR